MKYSIQVLDAQTYRIEYFDRLKTSYGRPRVITSPDSGKRYSSKDEAEADARIVSKYFYGEHLIDIVENE